MIYGTNDKGEGILTLSPEENERFKAGKPIVRESGDRLGVFHITAKLTRPARRSRRFPESVYGPNYVPEKNPVSASVVLKEEQQDQLRQTAERMLSGFDFSPDTFEGSDGWEFDSTNPTETVCTVYLRSPENQQGPSERCRFKVSIIPETGQPMAELLT